MDRQSVNRLSARAPIGMSLCAFALVLIAVSTGWGRRAGDEGAAAHIFQLLIAAQAPFLIAYLVTAQWKNWRTAISPIVLQVGAIGLALGPVAFFRL